ncbi:AraC family transcriptional regulator [uncultured Parabacteroides sp.]|jgi:AraC-like DNA-binding protein|uniref:helix-turn-helix transcriptional regulator n=1 Tax=uncultured Parabacteroides sp. TaxID=512312 RepID=UPI0025F0F856|nr:AraC family transcriptional regulator [uncultured Parabacteroides sp.]
MLYLNQTYELLTGGYYLGNSSWNKKHTEIDNCFKIYQLTEGEVFVCDKDQTFNLQKNNLYFINGNKLSSQYCSYSFSTHWLHFIPKNLTIYQGLLSLPTVIKLPTQKINFPDLMPLLEKLLTTTTSSSWEYSLNILHIQTLLQTITLELFTLYPIDQLSISIETQRIEPAMIYMNQYYKEPIKLEQLANQCCMSPNYFHKIFRNTLNMTPANYLTLLRMNAALQLLTDEQQTIKNIAYELGFTDDAHFCRSFKKYYGIPPGEYQKRRKDILI